MRLRLNGLDQSTYRRRREVPTMMSRILMKDVLNESVLQYRHLPKLLHLPNTLRAYPTTVPVLNSPPILTFSRSLEMISSFLAIISFTSQLALKYRPFMNFAPSLASHTAAPPASSCVSLENGVRTSVVRSVMMTLHLTSAPPSLETTVSER